MSARSLSPVEEFSNLMRILSTVVTHSLEPSLIARAGGQALTVNQLNVLRLVSLNGSHSLKEIAFFSGISLPAASCIVDRLVDMNLVSREENADDRRLLEIEATRKGRELVRRYNELNAREMVQFARSAGVARLSAFNEVARELVRWILSNGKFKRRHCLQCGAYERGGCLVADIKGVCDYLPAHAETRKAKNIGK